MSSRLGVELAGLKLKNPVMSASGTFGFADCFNDFFDPASMGAVVVKAVTPEPRKGNPPQRIAETASGMLNAIGLENPGLDEYLRVHAPRLMSMGTNVIVNVAGYTAEDYVRVAAAIEQEEAAHALELNISCPNVKEGGIAFGSDAASAASLTSAVKRAVKLPLIVKLSPNVTDICAIAKACESEGADALSMINTLLGMAIDIKTGRPVLANLTGGLSGPAVKPVALRMVWQVTQKVAIPVIGMGGITSWQDALEFMMAGANAVAIGTGQLMDPLCIPKVIKGLEEYCGAAGLGNISEAVGSAHPGRNGAR